MAVLTRVWGWSYDQPLLASGFPVIIPFATVAIYEAGTVIPVSLFADAAETIPLANPLTSDTNGYFFAYLSAQRIDVRFSGGVAPKTVDVPYTLGDYLPFGSGATTVQSLPHASFPPSDPAGGALIRQTDQVRGLWMDTGAQFFNLNNEWINVKEFGAVGDGITDDTAAFQAAITAARASKSGVYVPQGIYLISDELLVSGVDFIGQQSGDQGAMVQGSIWPILRATSGFARLLKVGPPTSADRDLGYSDHTTLRNFGLDLSGADANFIGVGSDFGCLTRSFENLNIRGLSGSVTAKNFTGIRLFASATIDTNAYNRLVNIHILHCAHAFDLASDFVNFCNANTLVNCFAFNARKFFSLCGLNNRFTNCGINSFEAGWTPNIATDWGVKIYTGSNLQGTSANTLDPFYVEGITGINRPFFYIEPRIVRMSVRGEIIFAYPQEEGGAPDFVQYIDKGGAVRGPLDTHGGVLISDDTVRAAFLNVPQVQQNRIPNGNFNAWPHGLSFSTPATGTPVAQGFEALKGGSTSYTISRILSPDAFTITHEQALRLQIVNNPGGVTGVRINLANFYTASGLQHMARQVGDIQTADGCRFCVGMLVRCNAAQAVLDGAYVSCHTGAIFLETTQVLRYDGTEAFGALAQQAGGWAPIFLNVKGAGTFTQCVCTFGMNNDGAHAGIGDFPIQSVFMYPGWYDWYTIWNVLQPRGLDAWAGANRYAVSDAAASAWVPGLIANGSYEVTVVNVADARLGDQCLVDYTGALAAGLFIPEPQVINNNGDVRVTIVNVSGGALTPAAGDLRVSVLRRSIS